jgi:hypothetical protein
MNGGEVSPAIEAVFTMWPSPLFDQQRSEGTYPVDDAVQVDAQHPLPVLERLRPDRSGRGDAGVVDHDVDGAEPGDSGVAQSLDLDGVAHVANHG